MVNAQADEEKRYRSVLELDLSGASALEALVHLLYDESWRVRGAAAERLASLPDRRVIAKLLATLGDRGYFQSGLTGKTGTKRDRKIADR